MGEFTSFVLIRADPCHQRVNSDHSDGPQRGQASPPLMFRKLPHHQTFGYSVIRGKWPEFMNFPFLSAVYNC
jgi:hypothetical protein